MTTKRIFGSVAKVALGLFGVSALMSSCAKEKTCTCSVTYTYQGISDSEEAFTLTAKTKDDCKDLEIELTDPDGNTSVSCK